MSTIHATPYRHLLSHPVSDTPAPTYIDPSQMQSQAGPSSAPSSTASKKAIAPSAKRRRSTEDPDESGDSSSKQTQQGRKRDGPKKKKASRACFHCQKAHLTCDDSRPCQRCIKRGFANNCTEGHRKKAKYLLDDEELEKLKGKSKSSAPEENSPIEPTMVQPQPPTTSESFPEDAYFGVPFDSGFSFGSEAANMEYSILSAILGNPSPPETSMPETPPPPSGYQWPVEPLPSSTFGGSPQLSENATFRSPYSASDSQVTISQASENNTSSLASAHGSSPFVSTYPYPGPMLGQVQQYTNFQQINPQALPNQPLHPLQPRYPIDPQASPGNVFMRPVVGNALQGNAASSPLSTSSPASTSSMLLAGPTASTSKAPASQLQAIMDRVTTPYDYTEGYHFLMKYLQSRFEKNDILRVVRALAIFRPSLIALQMPLSLDDEVFLEKCFQRSLLELEKLISFSGTPTAVWRRTGEICLVAPEFCMLTEWTMEELVGKKKYMYELFENQSVVEYWENFATHAFENTTQSVYSHCVLLKPCGAPIPATFCFSVRRDLFDIPSAVIGQWLPLL